MNEIRVRVQCTMHPSRELSPEELDTHFEDLADAFYDIQQIDDQSVEADFSEMTVTFDMIVKAESEAEAQHHACDYVRSAIHGAHGHTPGWEQAVNELVLTEPEVVEVYA